MPGLLVVTRYLLAVPIAWLAAVASVAVATCSVYVCSYQSASAAAVPVGYVLLL